VCEKGGVEALVGVLCNESASLVGQACLALTNITFGNDDNRLFVFALLVDSTFSEKLPTDSSQMSEQAIMPFEAATTSGEAGLVNNTNTAEQAGIITDGAVTTDGAVDTADTDHTVDQMPVLSVPVRFSVEVPKSCRLGYDDSIEVDIGMNRAELATNDVEAACRRAMPGVEFDRVWRGFPLCAPRNNMRSVTWLVDVWSDQFGETVLFEDKLSIRQVLEDRFGTADFDICSGPGFPMTLGDCWMRYRCLPKRPHRIVNFAATGLKFFQIWLDDQESMASLKAKIHKLKHLLVNKIRRLDLLAFGRKPCGNAIACTSELQAEMTYFVE